MIKKLMILKIAVLCFACAAFWFFSETLSAASISTSNHTENNWATGSADELEIFKLINKNRRQNGLGELQLNDDLEKLARNYSRKMADGKFFSHYDRNGNSVVQRAREMKIGGWRKIGENLFRSDPYKGVNKFAVEKWMQSSQHRQNILDNRYNSTGIGIAESRDGTIYITQVFAQR